MRVGVSVGLNEKGHLVGDHNCLILLVARGGIEPSTHGFSVRRMSDWPVLQVVRAVFHCKFTQLRWY
jgi:hypothetical protein